MKPGTRISIALVGAALLLVLLWLLLGVEGSSPASSRVAALPAPVAEDAAIRSPESETGEVPDSESPEEDPPPEAEVEPELAEPDPEEEPGGSGADHGAYAYDVAVLVVDRLDRPLAGAMVNAAPRRHPMNFVATTPAGGAVSVRWRAHVPLMDLVVAVSGPRGTWSGLRAFPVSSGGNHVLRVVMPEEWFTVQSTKVVTEDTYQSRRAEALARRQRAESREHPTPASFFMAPPMASGSGGRWFRWSGREELRNPRVQDWTREWNRHQYLNDLERGDLDGHERVVRREDGEWIRIWLGPRDEPHEEDVPAARGRVLDAWLRPAAGALVTAGADEETPLLGTYCDADGRFEIPLTLAGDYQVWAGGGTFGQVIKGRRFTGSDTNWGELVLDRGREFAGELFFEDGAPLAGWWLEIDALDGVEHVTDAAICGTDGRYVFPNVRGSISLLVGRPPDADSLMPVLIEPVGSVEAYEPVVIERLARAAVDATVTERGYPERGDTELRVWQEGTERGELAVRIGDEGFRTAELPEGWYRLVAVSPSAGTSDEVRVRVGRGRAPGATLELPGSARVKFGTLRQSRVARSGTLWLRGLEVDSRVAHFETELPRRMDLPAGEYVLELGDTDVSFAVLAGQDSVVALPEVADEDAMNTAARGRERRSE